MATPQEVASIYQNLLGRAPDAQGLNWYQQYDPTTIQNDIMKSGEYQAHQAQQPQVSTSQQLINQIAGYIKPVDPYSQTFEQYAAPQQEVYNQWVNQMAKPQFEQQTLNPFNEAYSNNAAAGGQSMMGNGAQNYSNALRSTQIPFENQLASANTSYQNMMRQGYNQKIQDYANNTLTGFNTAGNSIPKY